MTNSAGNIDDVIKTLEEIISESEKNNDTLGYFAALYQRVTIQIKEGIKTNIFENGQRMVKLDIVFAKRYIDAWQAWKNNEPVTQSWEKAFSLSNRRDPIVLQHLLMGMNAHINLDLGIAASGITHNESISDLQADFFKINEILASLVNEVQDNLSVIWPTLKKILSKTGKIDNFLVDFSMETARDGAWQFARELSALPSSDRDAAIEFRDKKVAEKSKIITQPKFIIKIVLWLIRLGERGTVSEKIQKLKYVSSKEKLGKN